MRVCLILLSFWFLTLSCEENSKLKPEAEAIEVDLEITRFDQIFAQSSAADLPQLKQKYSDLFLDHIPDSLWVAKMQSDLQHEIDTEVQNVFPDFEEEAVRIEHFFKYVKYYFPSYKIPEVYTLAEEVNYRIKLVLSEDLLLISLDNYLGKDHKFYKGLPQYIAFMQDKKFLISDIARAFAKQKISPNRMRTFLADMVYHGKMLYMKDLLMPFESDAAKIYYSEDQLTWAEENEKEVWAFFVERDLIFSTDNRLEDRFISLAPYSKFYLELDSESSPRIGHYIGWQIVRAYMKKNPNTSIKDLLEMRSDLIFENSKYKP